MLEEEDEGQEMPEKDIDDTSASCEDSMRQFVLPQRISRRYSEDVIGKPSVVTSELIRTSRVESDIPSLVKWW